MTYSTVTIICPVDAVPKQTCILTLRSRWWRLPLACAGCGSCGAGRHPGSQAALRQAQEAAASASRSSGAARHRALAPHGAPPSRGSGEAVCHLWAGDVALVRAEAHRGGLLPCCRRGDPQDPGPQFLITKQNQFRRADCHQRYCARLWIVLWSNDFRCNLCTM